MGICFCQCLCITYRTFEVSYFPLYRTVKIHIYQIYDHYFLSCDLAFLIIDCVSWERGTCTNWLFRASYIGVYAMLVRSTIFMYGAFFHRKLESQNLVWKLCMSKGVLRHLLWWQNDMSRSNVITHIRLIPWICCFQSQFKNVCLSYPAMISSTTSLAEQFGLQPFEITGLVNKEV